MPKYGKLPSLTGQVFGKWTAGEGRRKKRPNTDKFRTYYVCTCTCGNISEMEGASLTSGKSTQCVNCRNADNKKQFCVRGHDTFLCGRNTATGGNHCRLCLKALYLKRTYGITIEEYVALYEYQEGKCAICGRKLALLKVPGKPDEEGRAEVDHEHIPKKQKVKPPKKDTVRGLLCGGKYAGCNIKLGRIDKPEWLRAALAYTESPPAQQLFKKGKSDNKSK